MIYPLAKRTLSLKITLILIFIGFLSSCKVYREIPLKLENQVPTIQDLENFYDTLSLGFKDNFIEQKWTEIMGGPLGTLEYTFDNSDDPFHRFTIYNYYIEVEADAEDARAQFETNVLEISKTLLDAEFDEKELRKIELPGELHFAAEYQHPNGASSTLVVALMNNYVVTFFFNGDQNEFPELIEKFLLPYLEYTASKAYGQYDRIAPMQTI